MQLAREPEDIRTILAPAELREELQYIGSKSDDQQIGIVFCVIPDKGPTYGEIKRAAELNYGVLTQCIKSKTIYSKGRDFATISNILLKVNAKLNGTNHKVQTSPILGKKVLFIGADVTHPSPDQKDVPSVVGVAASYDEHAFCYVMYWRRQIAYAKMKDDSGERRIVSVEIIRNFKDIIEEHLKFYVKKNEHLPEKIFYYRDGVSDSQFDQVMANEVQAMRKACAAVKSGFDESVKITVVVVQKRHHTRFFPEIPINPRDKYNNVPPGTIVDQKITRPNENQFFLVSHQSVQGVAKPTKYWILLDDGNHKINDLEILTHNVSFTFF